MLYILILLVLLIFVLSYKYAWWKPKINWNQPRILMYHMVRNHIDGAKFNKLRVKPAEFEKQILMDEITRIPFCNYARVTKWLGGTPC